MALMFSRLANNFVKNGYFPTDEDTLGRLLQALDAPADGKVSLLDPCCGEGAALAELGAHLTGLGAQPQTFGVEYNGERAQNARQWLDVVAHSDIADMAIRVISDSFLQNNNRVTQQMLADFAKRGVRHDFNSLALTYTRYGDFGYFLIVT